MSFKIKQDKLINKDHEAIVFTCPYCAQEFINLSFGGYRIEKPSGKWTKDEYGCVIFKECK